ncbi:carcinoembryonic antigen-related cell adhesion molecule 2 [Etheostoma cragini]|uniref:carcinoembryonic antigen-related cell adhesion molecule 2 n=1 Tax=Etheostoma cragini TaxID=417921 RepID=UPI00155E9708|nr:carcinoembryonic antigen-related cell adhesion molecule 2 [Etheostoma cragini]
MDPFAVNTLLLLLSFIGCCAGQILPNGPVDAVSGTNVTLQTTLGAGSTYAFIVWNMNTGDAQSHVATLPFGGVLNVNSPYRGRVAINSTNGFLYLGPVKAADNGHYSISVLLPDGTTLTGETQLRVLEPVSGVTITSNVPEAVEHNSTVVLNCSAKGSFLKFAWLKGDAPIVVGNRFTVKEAGLSSTLTITDVLRGDLVGPIYCTAANQLQNQKSAPFNLTVYYGPETVTITPSPPGLGPVIGSQTNFSLSCSATSNPPATFAWYHNRVMLEHAGPVLTLEVIRAHGFGSKEGEYTCRAQNAKTGLVIPSPAFSLAVMDAISGAKLSSPIANLIAGGNSTANLSCQATSGTVKTITWHKDGQPLSAGGRLVFFANMSSLMISPLQKEDNGEYRCRLANPIHSVEASYKMVVNYGPEKAEVSGKAAVEVNDNVVFTCSAQSIPPANFTWKFNGTDTGVRTAQFRLEMASAKDIGKYTCEANNAVTGKTAMYTHSLNVQDQGTLQEGLSDGAIAGIVIGVLLALGLAIGLLVYCRQKVPVESPY